MRGKGKEEEKREEASDEGKASRGEEGICVPSAGRRDLIRACRVSLGIVGKCLLSQEMVYKRIGPSTLAGQRFTPLFRTELNFCLDLSTSARPTENRLREDEEVVPNLPTERAFY